jgi:hypothetical protein
MRAGLQYQPGEEKCSVGESERYWTSRVAGVGVSGRADEREGRRRARRERLRRERRIGERCAVVQGGEEGAERGRRAKEGRTSSLRAQLR